jgi:hypothetical protein
VQTARVGTPVRRRHRPRRCRHRPHTNRTPIAQCARPPALTPTPTRVLLRHHDWLKSEVHEWLRGEWLRDSVGEWLRGGEAPLLPHKPAGGPPTRHKCCRIGRWPSDLQIKQ